MMMPAEIPPTPEPIAVAPDLQPAPDSMPVSELPGMSLITHTEVHPDITSPYGGSGFGGLGDMVTGLAGQVQPDVGDLGHSIGEVLDSRAFEARTQAELADFTGAQMAEILEHTPDTTLSVALPDDLPVADLAGGAAEVETDILSVGAAIDGLVTQQTRAADFAASIEVETSAFAAKQMAEILDRARRAGGVAEQIVQIREIQD